MLTGHGRLRDGGSRGRASARSRPGTGAARRAAGRAGGRTGSRQEPIRRQRRRPRARLRGPVLLGRCDRDGGGPFQPFVIALRQFLRSPPRAHPSPRPPCRRPADRRSRSWSSSARACRLRPSDDAAADRLLLFDAIADAFHGSPPDHRCSSVEDIHWAAPETVQLLRHLVGWHRTPRCSSCRRTGRPTCRPSSPPWSPSQPPRPLPAHRAPSARRGRRARSPVAAAARI